MAASRDGLASGGFRFSTEGRPVRSHARRLSTGSSGRSRSAGPRVPAPGMRQTVDDVALIACLRQEGVSAILLSRTFDQRGCASLMASGSWARRAAASCSTAHTESQELVALITGAARAA